MFLFCILCMCISCNGYHETYNAGHQNSIDSNKYYYDNELYYSETGINDNRYDYHFKKDNQSHDIIYVPVIIQKPKQNYDGIYLQFDPQQ